MFRYAVLIAFLLTLDARAADRPAKLEPVPDIPPPPGVVESSLEPQVTIQHKGNDRVEEYRIRGRLYMIKVTPPHGKPYYLIDMNGDGMMRHFNDLSPEFMIPMWVIGTF